MAGTTQRSVPFRILRIGAAIVVALALLLCATFVIFTGLSRGKAGKVRAAWAERLGSPDQIFEAYPPRDANVAALALEALSAKLGIDLASKSYDGRARPAPDASTSFNNVKGALGDYVNRELMNHESPLAAPPPAVATFLEQVSGDLDALREQLLSGESPRWELHLERMYEAPIPNLLGHISLQRLLVSDALLRHQRGDRQTALADLNASYRLNLALRDDPILITQLISIAVTRLQVGALRRFDDPPVMWGERLREHDFKASMLAALAFEGWIMAHDDSAHEELQKAETGKLEAILRRLVAPFEEYCMFDASDTWLIDMARLERRDHFCTGGRSEPFEFSSPPSWNYLAKLIMPNAGSALERLGRLELDLELTEKWLALNDLRRESAGSWPSELPGGAESVACPGETWIYRLDDDTGSLGLSRDVEWHGVVGLMLPTRLTFDLPGIRH